MRKKHIIRIALLTFFTFSFSLFTNSAFAQNLDSLYTVWQDQTQSDSIRSKAFADYIWDGFLFSQPDTAFVLAEELVVYGLDNNHLKVQAIGYTIQGVSWINRGDSPKALDYYTRALEIFKQIGDQAAIAVALNNLGTVCDEQGDYPKALDYYMQSLKLNERAKSASTISNIGFIYMNQGHYTKALDYFMQSLEIMGKSSAANTLTNIGLIHMYQGDYPKALDYQNQAIEINEQMGDQVGIAISFDCIGDIYNKQGDYSKALDYYMQSQEINEQMGDQIKIASSLIRIGLVYQEQEEYTKALTHCQTGYELSLSIGSLERQKDGCSCLYDTYKGIGNDNKALKYFELLNVIEDSLHSEETVKKLRQMEFAKQVLADSLVFAKSEALSKLELEKSENTNKALIGGSVLLMLLAGFIFYGYRQKRKANRFLEERNKFEIENKKKALTLFSQHVSPEVAKELLSDSFKSGTNKVRACIMFLDIRNFTPFAENREPTEIIQYQNDVFGFMIDIVSKHHGIVNQFMGDGFLAMFGAPVSSGNDSQNAVKASLEILKELEVRCASGKLIETKIGIGLHTGDIVTGNVGTAERRQYSITGNTVILASRIEQLNKPFKSELLISSDVLNDLDIIDDLNPESLGPIELKGRSEPMEIFKLS